MALLQPGATLSRDPASALDHGSASGAGRPAWTRPLVLALVLGYRWLGVSLAAFCLYLLPINAVDIDTEAFQPLVIQCAVLLGLAAAFYWTSREARIDSVRVQYYLEALVRYTLAWIFITYGVAKLYQIQFKPLSLFELDRPIGSMAGIQITWAFFGYSFAYAAFVGLSQIACSLLLACRRTQLLGACLLMPIIGNIVFINFTHHIPVKLYSCIYLVMTGYLVLADWERLKALFWDNAPAPPRALPALAPRWRAARLLGKALFVAAAFACAIRVSEMILAPVAAVMTPVYGAWRVAEVEPPGALVATGGEARGAPWTKVLFEKQFGGKEGAVKFGDDYSAMTFEVDAAQRTLRMKSKKGLFATFTGTYERAGDEMVLTGRVGESPVRVRLTLIRQLGR